MKIIWIKYKRFDRDMSKVTWIEMTKELLKEGHLVHLVVPYSGHRPDFGVGKKTTYLPVMPWRILYSLNFSVSLFFYLIPLFFPRSFF